MNDQKDVLDTRAVLILVVLCVSWGVQQVAVKVALPGVSPILQSGLRSVVAALLVWLWMRARREPVLDRDNTFWWGIAAGLLFAGEFLLIYVGLEYTNASRAVIFLYLSPFVVALGAQIFLPGERLTPSQITGLCCAFAGIVVAFSDSLRMSSPRILLGDAMLIGAAILWGATTILIKASPLARVSPGKTLLYQLGASAVVLPLGSLVAGEAGIVHITPLILASLAYQAIWIAFATYLAWFWLVRHYPAPRLASFTFLTPLFGVLAGGLLLNEPITAVLMGALALVGSGIYLVNRPQPVRT